MNRTASMILGLTLAACGGPKEAAAPAPAETQPVEVTPPVASAPAPVETAPAPVETAAAAQPAPPIDIAPFTLIIDDIGKPAGKVTLDLAADGTIKASNKGKVQVLKFVGNELRDDKDWVARVLADGTVEMKSVHVSKRNGKVEKEETTIRPIGKLGANDELTIDKGGSVRVGDDGAVVFTGVDPKLDPTKGVKLRFKGVTAQSRRAATILFVSVFAGNRSESDLSDATSTPAVPASAPTK